MSPHRRFLGNARHWFGMRRAMRDVHDQSVAANVYAEAQPELVKLTDNGVRKMVVSLGDRNEFQPVSLSLVIPDAQGFLDEVWACAQWVVHGDKRDLEGKGQ